MEIIVEYVLVDNLVINYLILYLSTKLLRGKQSFWRFAVASSLGTAVALITPLMLLPAWVNISFKLLLGWIMVRIALTPKTIKKELIAYLTFLGITALMGGVCFGIVYALSGDIELSYLLIYDLKIPVGVILLTVALITLLISKMIKYFYRKKLFDNFVFKTYLYSADKKIKINAFLDTGNTLIDSQTNKPVIIIDYQTFNKLYQLPMEKVLTKSIDEKDIRDSHYITFSTIGKKSESMLVFTIDKMEVFIKENDIKKFENVELGLSFTKLGKTLDCGALLHPMLIDI